MSFLTKLFWAISFVATIAYIPLGLTLAFYTLLWTVIECTLIEIIRIARNGN